MRRRTLLRATGLAGVAGLAGCTSLFDTRSARSPPLAEFRPNAVYLPTHSEGMVMGGMGMAGDLQVAVTYAFPERFWTVTGAQTQMTEIRGDDSMHLMVVVWNPETGVYFPDPGLSIELQQAGELVSQEIIYPMLSQRMGFHYGANFSVPGDGTYTARVTLPAVGARTTGGFTGTFGESHTADIEFEFSQQARDDLPYQTFDDAGAERALSPMEMAMVPSPSLPTPEEMPGTYHATATTGDAHLAVLSLDTMPEGVDSGDGDGGYLAVSARTPYNRMPLPMMGLEGTLVRDDETVFEGTLERSLDPELHYHYGAAVPDTEAGDELTLSVATPPQVARHEGYEMAFLDMPETTVAL